MKRVGRLGGVRLWGAVGLWQNPLPGWGRLWVFLGVGAGLWGLGGSAQAGSTRPYYTRSRPVPQDLAHFSTDSFRIDLGHPSVHRPPFVDGPVQLSAFTERFDARAAATVSAAVGLAQGVRVFPEFNGDGRALLNRNEYSGEVPARYHAASKCLAAMAYLDYFPASGAAGLRPMVSEAILAAQPGWCGTFGPGIEGSVDLITKTVEGNYDMGQMHLIPLVYRYYDELTPPAREHLINELLQKGIIHRPNEDDTHTSGSVPGDWARAGFISPLGAHKDIGETENHILMILTARYFSNQLLYQRTQSPVHDNRRNGIEGGPHCTDLVLSLLRNILRDDFSEYNAKNYQQETRWALLNLCTYAYDHEVRLAARLVLDYVSARVAVSSSDLRRMVPFRRRNEGKNVTQLPGGFMGVGLLEWQLGADPLTRFFTLQTGNTRAYESKNLEKLPPDHQFEARPWDWSIAEGGNDLVIEVLSDYRLPPSIHDLFVNDLHRRFFQRLRRTPRPEETGGNRNVDHMEINAGSPSYLITAGGEPAPWAIDPHFGGIVLPNQDQQLGVAVTTSFMPTGQSAGQGTQNMASQLIQFGSFSDEPGEVANYGVAPDFACGHRMYKPPWVQGEVEGQFLFVRQGSAEPNRPGFYLAIYEQENGFSLLEAHDVWLHPGLTFREFKDSVRARNPSLHIESGVPAQYTTHNGNRIQFVIWDDEEREEADAGAVVLRVDYGEGDPADRIGDAGNITDKFLNGTIMNSPGEAVVQISNPFLGTTITLDLSDRWHPKRIDESGRVEQAGFNNEVWVDFDWRGPAEGDFYRPFNSLAAALAAVAEGGVIKIMPGRTSEKPLLRGKRVRLLAPIGGVVLGGQ